MIGDNIKKYREMLKYSQAYVAEELGISQNAYSKIENNQTKSFTVDRLEKVAALFQISLADLIGIEKSIAVNNVDQSGGFGYVNHHYDASGVVALLKEEVKILREEKAQLLKIIDKLANSK
ncbi:MAG: helix-turn-helix domain-containing protein [Thermonemataceae bacterium]